MNTLLLHSSGRNLRRAFVALISAMAGWTVTPGNAQDTSPVASTVEDKSAATTSEERDAAAFAREDRQKFDRLFSDCASLDLKNGAGRADAVIAREIAGSELERLASAQRLYTVCRVMAERGDPQQANRIAERLAARLAQSRRSGATRGEYADLWTALEVDVYLHVLNDADAAAAVLADVPSEAAEDTEVVKDRRREIDRREKAEIEATLAGEMLRDRMQREASAKQKGGTP
jgi:hypothetical protein